MSAKLEVQSGKLYRVDKAGLGVIVSDSTKDDYPFTFDKIDGYKGESLKELGLSEGQSVRFVLDAGRVARVTLERRAPGRVRPGLELDKVFSIAGKVF